VFAPIASSFPTAIRYSTMNVTTTPTVSPSASGKNVRRAPGGERSSFAQIRYRTIGTIARISIAQPRFHHSREKGGVPTYR